MNTQNLPKWNLDSIYPDVSSAEFKKAVEDFKNKITELKQINAKMCKADCGGFDGPSYIAEFLKADENAAPLANTLAAYSYSVYSTNTTSKDYLDNLNKIENLITQYENETNTFSNNLGRNASCLKEFYERFPEYKKYEFYINEVLQDIEHKMAPAFEQLASTLQQTGGKAWDRLHEQLISNMRDEETKKMFNELRNDAYS
nr:peptidase M3 [Treponema sp.]